MARRYDGDKQCEHVTCDWCGFEGFWAGYEGAPTTAKAGAKVLTIGIQSEEICRTCQDRIEELRSSIRAGGSPF